MIRYSMKSDGVERFGMIYRIETIILGDKPVIHLDIMDITLGLTRVWIQDINILSCKQ